MRRYSGCLEHQFGLAETREGKSRTLFCDITEATDELGIVRRLARVLDIRLRDTDPIGHLADVLGAEPTVLVLDNLEQVRDAVGPMVQGWVRLGDGTYTDVLGLCRYVHIDEIEEQGWSLNPGRYVGVKVETIDEGVFKERMKRLYDEFHELTEVSSQLSVEIKRLIRAAID